MRSILHNHPLALGIALLIAAGIGLKLGATVAVGHFGPWIAVPIVGVFLLTGLWLQRRDQRRG